MIYVFSGDDRGRIQAEVKRILGGDYEVYEGQNLGAGDLMDIFLGTTIFAFSTPGGRRILIKDLTPERGNGSGFDAYEEIGRMIGSGAGGSDAGSEIGGSGADSEIGGSGAGGFDANSRTIVIWESRKSTKGSFRKFVKMAGVEERTFRKERDFSETTIFDAYRMALRDGRKAVKMVEEIEEKSDPYMSFGAMVSVAIKNYGYRYGAKERRILQELAKLDIEMKTSEVDGWSLLKGFLARVETI